MEMSRPAADEGFAPEVVERLEKLAEMSRAALRPMFYREGEHAGLHSFKVVPDGRGGWTKIGVSLRYSLIAWVGLFEADGVAAAQDQDWPAARLRLERIVKEGCAVESLADLGLMLWLDALAGCGWKEIVLAQMKKFLSTGSRMAYCDTLEFGLGLVGAVRAGAGDEARLLTEAILHSYNPATRLFAFQAYRPRTPRWQGRYRHVLGSFASQVYSILGLSHSLLGAGDRGGIADIVREASAGLVELQGPNGEWWWIYDVRTREVVTDYPVYSVHQDGMGPMALLAGLRAAGGDPAPLLKATARGLRWIEEYRCGGEGIVDSGGEVIYRATVRNVPGPDPADLSFGLSPAEFRAMTRRGLPAVFARKADFSSYPDRLVKEARAYCPGWMLYAFAESRKLRG